MYRKWIGTAVISAAIGAGLMLLAIGARPPAGVDGWVPVNTDVAKAMESHEEPQMNANNQTQQTKRATSSSADGHAVGTNREAAAAESQPSAAKSSGSADSSKPSESAGTININTAGLEELQNIPGIGAKKAAAIMDYRNQHGAFSKVSDLTKIKGIGPKVLEKMKPFIGL
ncbi:ComEA family DNA-binding protein [Paenibacillus sp. SN-8-1]|uniref:ComEA family DNA-binding protein n=1 Tax=Paenibacillus sp. SN-8-1 TaxID=3435409 RepID=UPI003D9A872C